MLTALGFDDPLRFRPKRVIIAGVSGTGKTTLAARIAPILNAPHTEIDALYHGPNWTPREEFMNDVRVLVKTDRWTTEWQFSSARPILAEHADLLVWLDLPFLTVTLPRVVGRTLMRRLRREALWNGNLEPPPAHLLHRARARRAVGARNQEQVPRPDSTARGATPQPEYRALDVPP